VYNKSLLYINNISMSRHNSGLANQRRAYTYHVNKKTTHPSPPIIIQGEPGINSALVYFIPPQNDGGIPISNYLYSIDNGQIYYPFTPRQITSPFTINNLSSNTTYSIKIIAINTEYSSIPSNTVVITLPPISGSNYFPTTSSRIDLSYGIIMGETTQTPFTVEGWFYSTVKPGTNSGPVLLSTSETSSIVGYSKALTINLGDSIHPKIVIDSNGVSQKNFDFPDFPEMTSNTWYYLAVSRDSSGNIQTWLAKKGDSFAVSNNDPPFNSSDIGLNDAWSLTGKSNCIGAFVPASRFTTGYISNLRISTTNLYQTNVSTIPLPTAPFTVLSSTVFLSNDNTLLDKTGNQIVNSIGGVSSVSISPFD
jgi:hypothetical protein